METSYWRPRKKSPDKMASAAEMLYGSSRKIKGKARTLPPGSGAKPESARKSLNEKLATVVLDSHIKDTHMRGYNEKEAEEKVEAEEIFLKNEVDGSSGNEIRGNEEFPPAHVASDEFLWQSGFLKEDHERNLHDSAVDASVEIKKERKELEDNLIEMKRRLESLATENCQLRNSLAVKERLVEGLHDRKSQLESEFEALMSRLDSVEKENAFLRYEYHVLEKDLEVRTEEMEYTRRSIDLAHKQHLRSVNKIVELEAECQRLRLLVRKKFPGTTLLMPPKLRSEVEERKMEMRRKYVNTQNDLVIRDDFHNQKLNHNLLMEQLGNVREENKNLREIILKKNAEIKELSRGQRLLDLAKSSSSPLSYKLSPVSSFRVGSEDGISSDGSLSKALVSEWRDKKSKNLRGNSEMSLYMDDFAEMEKFAIVSTEKHPRDDENEKSFDWLQVVLNAILKQQRISKRDVKGLFEDIKIALGCMDVKDTKKAEGESLPLCIEWKSPGMSPKSGSMTKDEIKKHLGLNKSEAADEEVVDESLNCQKVSSQAESPKQDLLEEHMNLKDEIKKITSKSKELRLKLEESEEKIRSLETEMKTLKDSRGMIEEQMETQKSINEDLDTQLTVTRAKLNGALQKFSSLEVELDYRNSCCEELEGTCLELQLQLESVAKKEPPKCPMEKNRKQSQNGWEMTAASIKLAECQETILNLRKQLKALALPSNVRALPTGASSNRKLTNKGCSLRDQMLFEDDAIETPLKPEKNIPPREASSVLPADDNNNCNALIVYTPRVYSISKDEDKREGITTMTIVSSKKQGFGFLKKLLFRRKRRTSKKCLALAM